MSNECKHENYKVLAETPAGHGIILEECICEDCGEYFTKDAE
jgi:hypothetical protein